MTTNLLEILNREDRACVAADLSLFFPGPGGLGLIHIANAKALCGSCPVQGKCLAYAMEHPWLDGIWGGTDERAVMRRNPEMAR